MKIKTILGGAAVAAASAAVMSATPASATATYSFLDGADFFFTVASAPILTQTTVAPIVCSVSSACGTVTFTPTTSYDELTLANGSDFYFVPTAFSTFGHYAPLAGSADTTAQFATEITSAAPEPASWALMIAGVGFAGGMLRFGRRQDVLSAA